MLTDDQKAAVQARIVGDLKQACLDLAAAAGELFDLFDQHGLEAAWEGPLTVAKMEKAHNDVADFLRRQATNRMIAHLTLMLKEEPESVMNLLYEHWEHRNDEAERVVAEVLQDQGRVTE